MHLSHRLPALLLIALGATACQVTTPARVPTAIAQASTAPGTAATSRPGADASGAPATNGGDPSSETGSGGPGAGPSAEPVPSPSPSPSPKFGSWASFSGVVIHVRLPGSGLPYRVRSMANGIDHVEVRIGGVAGITQTLSPGPTDTQLDFSFPGLWDTNGYTVSARALNAAGAVVASSDRLLDLDASGHVRKDAQGLPLTTPGTFNMPPHRELVLQLTLGALNTKVTL